MNTPTERQTEKEKKPGANQSQPTTPRGQAGTSKRPPIAPQPARAPQRASQGTGKPNQSSTRTASQPATKATTPSAPKAATPPAPKPRDPSVAQRDTRREERRAEMQARQQVRRRELQRAKRRTLLVRYDLMIAPILLIGLVVFFIVTNHLPDAIISGAAVFVAAVALLAFATLMPTRAISPLPRSETSEAQDGPASDSAQPSAEQPDDQATSDDQK